MAIFNGRIEVVGTANFTRIVDDAVSATIQNVSSYTVEIVGSATGTAPATSTRGFVLMPGDALTNVLLSDLFPGLTTPRFVWARCTTDASGAVVAVSHA